MQTVPVTVHICNLLYIILLDRKGRYSKGGEDKDNVKASEENLASGSATTDNMRHSFCCKIWISQSVQRIKNWQPWIIVLLLLHTAKCDIPEVLHRLHHCDIIRCTDGGPLRGMQTIAGFGSWWSPCLTWKEFCIWVFLFLFCKIIWFSTVKTSLKSHFHGKKHVCYPAREHGGWSFCQEGIGASMQECMVL